MSVAGIRKSTIGPDHSGAAKPGFLAGPTTEGLAPAHGPNMTTNAARPSTGNIARDGAPKAHVDVPVHNGMKPQPAGGRAHAQGAAVDDGGQPAAGTVHPFAVAPSPQMAHGKAVPVAWSSGGASMRNRNNDTLHGGATPQSGCETGDAARELSHADPLNMNFRGKSFAQDCGD
jgi:hypothetical protein